jgi:hypothetical protein
MTPVLFLQDDSTVAWEPQYMPPGPEFVLLAFGNLPAAVISIVARPEAHIQNRKKLWDPIWFVLHETISFPLWFAIGVWVERGRVRLKKVMVGFLAGRFGFTAFLVVPGIMRLGSALEMLFWLCVSLYAIGIGLRCASRRVVNMVRVP